MATYPGVARHWFTPVASIAVAIIGLLVILRMSGVLSSVPLEETDMVFSLKWGLVIAFILQMVLVWRAHRKYSLTPASLANIPAPGSSELPEHLRPLDKKQFMDAVVLARMKTRSAFMLGNVTGALAMLAGLYLITKSPWCVLAIAVYAAFSAWAFRPLDPTV